MRHKAAVALFLAALCASAMAAGHEDLWARYQKGDRSKLVDEVRAALAAAPDDVELNLLLGRALADSNRFDEARAPLERTIALDDRRGWPSAWALAYLGRVHFALGDKEKARKALREAITLGATRNATQYAESSAQLLGLDASYDTWSVRETPHFVFHFAPSLRDEHFAAYAAAHEQAFEAIHRFFGGTLPRKIDFFVWGDPEVRKTSIRLGFARPELMVVHAHAKQTVGHEMTHVITWWAAHPTVETGMFNEGVAVCFDQSGNDQLARAHDALTKAGRAAPPIEAVWSDWTSIPGEVSYPLAGAFIRHLIDRGGRARFLELLHNQTLDNARAIYGADLAPIMASFDAAVNRQE